MIDASGRIDAQVQAAIDADGFAIVPGLLAPAECVAIAALYEEPAHFRRRVVMQQHAYGRGEYRYFSYPLPDPVARWRTQLYGALAPIANRWQEALRTQVRYPDRHEAFLVQCHADGQTRPTPLLLDYGVDDYNCLHQDLYGAHVFPLQVTVLLSAPGKDFTGGDFVLTEQRPRAQSRVEVVPLAQGDAVVFAVRERPAPGVRGMRRVQMRHGVSRVRSGHRRTLGIIFHDAA
jgi:hypothetical protein